MRSTRLFLGSCCLAALAACAASEPARAPPPRVHRPAPVPPPPTGSATGRGAAVAASAPAPERRGPPPEPAPSPGCTWVLRPTLPPERTESGCGACQKDLSRWHEEATARFVSRQVWVCDECRTSDDCASRGTPGFCRAGRAESGAERFTCREHNCPDGQLPSSKGSGCMPGPRPP